MEYKLICFSEVRLVCPDLENRLYEIAMLDYKSKTQSNNLSISTFVCEKFKMKEKRICEARITEGSWQVRPDPVTPAILRDLGWSKEGKYFLFYSACRPLHCLNWWKAILF